MLIKIATRGSKLALWQANFIKKSLIETKPNLKVELKIIKTSGDKIQDRPLSEIGGKGLFVKEIEEALLNNEADIAIHSMKDLPSVLPDELCIYATPKRESPADAFLSSKYPNLASLPEQAVLGTSSLRRKLQILNIRKDLTIKELRGNVDTRINKMINGEYDAIILAHAGLKRLGLTEHVKEILSVEKVIPAVCQGILAIEAKVTNQKVIELIKKINDDDTFNIAQAERSFLKTIEGSCKLPIACHAVYNKDKLEVSGYLSKIDGTETIIKKIEGDKKNAVKLGQNLAKKILEDGGYEILKSF